MKILVVDDEKDIQRLFEQRFCKERRSGQLEFTFAYSAAEALTFLEADAPADLALILTDINMPEMSGLELLKIIRNKYPTQKVFMITAYDDTHFRQQAQAYGADDFLTKPIDFEVLKEKIFDGDLSK
ncbi:MAG: response regulator [Saprospiraceae bacterium]